MKKCPKSIIYKIVKVKDEQKKEKNKNDSRGKQRKW